MLVNLDAESINTCDVVCVVPRLVGETEQSTIWLGAGAQVLVETEPEDTCDLIGADLFTAPIAVTGFASPVRIAGRQVSRVLPTADGAGSVLMFGNTGTMFTAPDIEMPDMVDLLNACASCGGGGGGGVVGEPWAPTATDGAGTVSSIQSAGSAFVSDSPEGAVLCAVGLLVNVSAGATPEVTLTGFPAPIGATAFVSVERTVRYGGDAGVPVVWAVATGSDEVVVTGPPVVLAGQFAVKLHMMYRRDLNLMRALGELRDEPEMRALGELRDEPELRDELRDVVEPSEPVVEATVGALGNFRRGKKKGRGK